MIDAGHHKGEWICDKCWTEWNNWDVTNYNNHVHSLDLGEWVDSFDSKKVCGACDKSKTIPFPKWDTYIWPTDIPAFATNENPTLIHDGLEGKYYEEPLMVTMPVENYNQLHKELELLKREKGDLAAQVEYHKKRASEFDHTAYLAQIESAKLQQEVTQLSKDRYAEAQRADKLQEKLARKGIPFKCRKMIKQLYAHGTFKGSNCCGVFDKIGCDSNNLKCNECGMQYTLEEIRQLSKVEKPAPLWWLKLQQKSREHIAKKIRYRYEHRNDAETIQKRLKELEGNIKYWKDNLKGGPA
jgi:hypothetical protein